MFIKRAYLLSTLVLLAALVQTTDLGPPSDPQTSESDTLTDICNRLNTSAAGEKSTFGNPAQGPSQATDCTLVQVMEKAPAINVNGTQPDDVVKSKKDWGLTDDNWGIQTGGGGVDCIGVSPRFTDNGNGTVTDNCTQLIWLRNANCWGRQFWSNAKSKANSLASGNCGLQDNSTAGAWHLPTVHELQSLIDYSQYELALPSGHPFSGVQTGNYWSSTKNAYNTGNAWHVNLNHGYVRTYVKALPNYVWPVRRR